MVGYIINSCNQRFWNNLDLQSFDFEPDEGYFSNVPDEGYFSNVPDEGYFKKLVVRTKFNLYVFLPQNI